MVHGQLAHDHEISGWLHVAGYFGISGASQPPQISPAHARTQHLHGPRHCIDRVRQLGQHFRRAAIELLFYKEKKREKSSDYFKTVLVEKDMEIMCIEHLQEFGI
jgi:hypothetical protein